LACVARNDLASGVAESNARGRKVASIEA